jgi:hypothetical protein
LHLQQFRGTLVLSIQVITCNYAEPKECLE